MAWQLVAESIEPGSICVRARGSDAKPWFDGHFPTFPVLPGIAMLALVEQAVRSFGPCAEEGLEPCGFSRVRFKSVVAPDVTTLRVRVQVAQGCARSFEFRVEADGVLACAGICEL